VNERIVGLNQPDLSFLWQSAEKRCGRHSGRAKRVPESIVPVLIIAEPQGVWIPERRFAASGMTAAVFFSRLQN
jgi:hypothetical protein